MIGILKRAVENEEKIQIIYQSKNGELSQRFVTVQEVNDTHAICFCHYKRQRRMFRLENILSATTIKKRFKESMHN